MENEEIKNKPTKIKDFAPAVIRLLQGVVSSDDKVWNDLLVFHNPIHEYFSQIGLELILNDRDGYAYLSQPEQPEDAKIKIPQLVARHKLSYEVSLLLVFLRNWLEEFDISGTEASRLCLTRKEIKEHIELFFIEKTNRSGFIRKLDEHINKVKDMGFLEIYKDNKQAPEDTVFEIKRIIKAKISNEVLSEILDKIAENGMDTIQ